MGTLWVEKSAAADGRTQALESLEASRPALALAEPESPGQSPGQPLAAAISPVYYRTKAAYVFWMLRDLAGDASLSAALRAYNPTPDPANHSARSQLEKLLLQAANRRDLSWFFADWVDADKGLPDLTIESVFPTPVQAVVSADRSSSTGPGSGNWLVAVTVANSGYASAEVPVTARSGLTSVTQRLLIPARGRAVQRILIQGKPTEVQVNDGAVPETTATVHITNLIEPAATPSSSGQPAPPPQ
jgi:hypothetical protein